MVLVGGERHSEDEMDKDEAGRERTRIFRDGLLPPLTLTVEQAESYSGLSRKYLDELTRMGKLDRRRVGLAAAAWFVVNSSMPR